MKKSTQSISDLYRLDPLKACRRALRETASLPATAFNKGEDRIDKINQLLGTHGTEAIRGDWQNGYWCDICAVYCNTGDTYALTVIQVRGLTKHDNSRFIISSVGDFVEKNQSKFNII